MANIIPSNRDNFLGWQRVNGPLTLADLQAYGLPESLGELDEFIYAVEVNASDTIDLPMQNADSLYNFSVDYGDGSPVAYITSYSQRQHTYTTAGRYTIRIKGTFDLIYCVGLTTKIIEILQWGPAKIGTSSFSGVTTLTTISAVDIPGIRNNSLEETFNGCTNLTYIDDAISAWDTAGVNNMDNLFSSVPFNKDISAWNISALNTAVDMLTGTTLSDANYSALLVGWEAQSKEDNVPFDTDAGYIEGLVASGTATATVSNQLSTSGQSFLTTVSVGDIVYNTTDTTYASVTNVLGDNALQLDQDIMISGENFRIQGSAAAKARYGLITGTAWIISDGGPS